ncbi:MAG TPA: VCBS repeat-containing protein, partial [Gemmataceae bacterium]|nr:VCBS repeat-containing protein [Gemmataceae bacterium]
MSRQSPPLFRRLTYCPRLELLEELTLLSFLPPVNYGVGDLPTAVAVGDFDGDGAPDLATANLHDVSVLLNNGDGTFRSAGAYVTGNRPYAVVAGDFNGDGNLDLAVANGGSTGDDTVSVLLGNGDGTFQAPVNYAVDANPKGLAVADLNGDGNLDLVLAMHLKGFTALLGDGKGHFTQRWDKGLDFLEPGKGADESAAFSSKTLAIVNW